MGGDIELCEKDIKDAIGIFQVFTSLSLSVALVFNFAQMNTTICILNIQHEEAKLNEYRYNEMSEKLDRLMQQKANFPPQQQRHAPLLNQEYQRLAPQSQLQAGDYYQSLIAADPDFYPQPTKSPYEVTIAYVDSVIVGCVIIIICDGLG